MARKAREVAALEAPAVVEERVREELATLDAGTLMESQQHAAVRAVAMQMGYELPADSTDPDLIQRDIAANMRRSVEALIEVGRGLIVLKQACGHGNFLARLGVLGIEQRIARRMMQASHKFSNRAISPVLTKAIGNQSKLFELLILDDDQIDELCEKGETLGLPLDEIDRMTATELRRALRERNAAMDAEIATLKADREADARLLATRTDKLNDLERRLLKIETGAMPLAEGVEPVIDEIAEFSKKADLEIRNLSLIFAAVETIAGRETEKPEAEADLAGVLPLVQRLRDAIDRVATSGARLQFEFENRLQHYIGAAEMFLAQDAAADASAPDA